MLMKRRKHARIDAWVHALIVGAGISVAIWLSYPLAFVLVLAAQLTWSRFWRTR